MIQLNTTSFKAKSLPHVNAKDIKKLNSITGSYGTCSVRVVELDTKNLQDYYTLENVSGNWDGQLFAGTIKKNAYDMINGYISQKENHIYFLTTQAENFDVLEGDNILGMAQLHKGNSNTAVLKYLQVLPKTKHGAKQREFIGIGQALVSFIKELYCCNIKVKPYYSTTDFYKKQGFEITDTVLSEYTWKNNKKK